MARPAATAASQICARNTGVSAGEGASSTIFWCRRWMEHSRSKQWITWPWLSPRIWTSTWRIPSRNGSRKTRSSPKAPWASRRALSTAAVRSPARPPPRTPRAPPPGPPPPGRGLDEERVLGACRGRLRRLRRALHGDGGERRHAGLGHQGLRGKLVAHGPDGLRGRPDPDKAGLDHGLRTRPVLREE